MGQSYKTKLKWLSSRVTRRTVLCVCLCASLAALCGAAAAAAAAAWLARDAGLYELVPRPLHKYLRFPDNHSAPGGAPADPERLRRHLERLTYEECEIRHWKRYGPVQRDTPLVVVQVHRDAERLQYLVLSLAGVRHISTALVVFSHSYYDPAINKLVRAIDFCKVMQIFYPYSLQTHPDRFPGPAPEDCAPGPGAPRDGCVPRDARRTERKQHWWWQARYVFESFEWSATHRGMVLFVPEHAWLAPDALHMLAAARRALTVFPRALLVALGRPATAARERHYDLLAVDAWRPPYHLGLALNRTAWRRIAALADRFCMHDDCSWSYSLLHALRALPGGRADMVSCVAPRVTSTRRRGAGGSAGALAALQRQAVAARAARLFPARVRAMFVWGARGHERRAELREPRGAGGWADVRDQLFCIDPLGSTAPAPPDYFDFSSVPPPPRGPPARRLPQQ